MKIYSRIRNKTLETLLRRNFSFAIILITFLIVVVQLISAHLYRINFAYNEIKGLQYLMPFSQLIKHIQGYQLAALNSNPDSTMSAEREKVTQLMNQMNTDKTMFKATQISWPSIHANITQFDYALTVDRLSPNAASNVSKTYELLSQQTKKLIIDVCDESQLTLDPDIASYYLMDTVCTKLPNLLSNIAEQMILHTQTTTNNTTKMETLNTLNKYLYLPRINDNIARAIHDQPWLEPPIMPSLRKMNIQFISMEKMNNPNTRSLDLMWEEGYALNQKASDLLTKLLKVRAHHLLTIMIVNIFITIFLIIALIYLFFARTAKVTVQKQKVENILNSIPDSIFVLDTNGRIKMVNTAAGMLVKESSGELVNKGISSLFGNLIMYETKRHINTMDVIDNEKYRKNNFYESSLRFDDGTTLPVEIVFSENIIAKDEAPAIICVVRNILEKEQSEIYSHLQHEITNALMEALSIQEAIDKVIDVVCERLRIDFAALWVVDEKSDVLKCRKIFTINPTSGLTQFANITKEIQFEIGTGLPGRVWADKKPSWIFDVVKDPNFPRATWALEADLHSAFAFPILTKDNEIIAIIEFFVRRYDNLERLIYLFTDICRQLSVFVERESAKHTLIQTIESKRTAELLAENLQKSKHQIEEVSKIKSEFMANMSHELRTPLNAIIGYSEMMREDAIESGLKEYENDLGKVIYSAKHLLTLISDVLDLSKIESGKMGIDITPNDLEMLLNEISSIATPLVTKNNNIFEIRNKSDVQHFNTDTYKLKQSLLNLLSNAGKFTSNGTITLNISNTELNDEPAIRFDVTDTGIGIPKDKISKLFTAFSQVDSGSTKRFGGTGLGLYLSKKFIQMLKGKVEITSKINVGSTFAIILPLTLKEEKIEAVAPPHEEDMSTVHPHENGATDRKKILIVDDEVIVHKFLKTHLKDYNVDFLDAYTGKEGLEVIYHNKIDLIILDIFMPIMDGWTMLSLVKAKKEYTDIPIIILSIDETEKNLGLALGAFDYFVKPVNPAILIDKIKKLISIDQAGKVLVVDDDPNARELLTKALTKKTKLTVIEAQNGLEALEVLQEETPNIIILDLMMPVMDGFAFIEERHKNEKWRNIPVFIVTARDLSEEERHKLLQFSEHIFKKSGYVIDDLIKLIKQKLNESLKMHESPENENES